MFIYAIGIEICLEYKFSFNLLFCILFFHYWKLHKNVEMISNEHSQVSRKDGFPLTIKKKLIY